MKRLIVPALLLTSQSLLLLAAEFDPFDGPKPIAVLIQTDPWAMVMGADTPRVAVYEDGAVIFLKDGNSADYHHRRLSVEELADFKKRLAPVTGVKGLKRSYNLRPNVSDQPKALFYVRDGARELVTSVYGLKATGTRLPACTVIPGSRDPDDVPEELIELHKFLSSLRYSKTKVWSPRYVEVMIWPYEYAPDASITWPKDWPGLGSQRSLKRGDSYSIFLDGSVLPKLQKFLRKQKEKGAVEIGGKKWAVSYRSVFPSEPVWRKAFESSQAK